MSDGENSVNETLDILLQMCNNIICMEEPQQLQPHEALVHLQACRTLQTWLRSIEIDISGLNERKLNGEPLITDLDSDGNIALIDEPINEEDTVLGPTNENLDELMENDDDNTGEENTNQED